MKITQTGVAWRSILITTTVVTVLVSILVTLLPKGYKDDLSRIGKGVGTVVLIHNKNGVQSLNLMGLVDKVRPDFEGHVEFLIAEVDTASGRAFLQSQQASNVGLVLFAADGKRLGFVDGNIDRDALRATLGNAFPKPR